MTAETTARGVAMASGLSARPDAPGAADEACERAAEAWHADRAADLALVFVSPHHAESLGAIAHRIAHRLEARHVIGCTAGAVLGAEGDLEGSPGVSVLACSLPGVRIVPFGGHELIGAEAAPDAAAARAGEAMAARDDLRAAILLADPFSVPLVRVLPAMNAGRVEVEEHGRRRRVGVIMGGMASGASSPGGNALTLDGQVWNHGAVGVSLSGPLRVDTVVSQGCRPVGPRMIVTKARSNMIMELSGRPALEMIREAIGTLPDADRPLLAAGLFLGRVVDEYKERFGRGDFLIRNIVGAEESTGAIAVADLMRVGQTVQLQLRDKATAREDLELLLDAQRLHDPPAGGLLFTCNGRGRRFFGSPHADVAVVQRAFGSAESGEERAKGGRDLGPPEPAIPLAGFFAAGEIGPVGDESSLHGHTACLALFRDP